MYEWFGVKITGFAPVGKSLPKCPVCGEELSLDADVYRVGGDVVGCEHCIECSPAYDVFEDGDAEWQ